MEFKIYSASDAMKGKQLLQRAGIRVFIGKKSGENGCYYYLKVADRSIADAKEILLKNGILT